MCPLVCPLEHLQERLLSSLDMGSNRRVAQLRQELDLSRKELQDKQEELDSLKYQLV